MKAKLKTQKSHPNSPSVCTSTFFVATQSANLEFSSPVRIFGSFPEAIEVWGDLIAHNNCTAAIGLAQRNSKFGASIIWDDRSHGIKTPRILATKWMAQAIAGCDDYIGPVPCPIEIIVGSLRNFEKGPRFLIHAEPEQATEGNGYSKEVYHQRKRSR